MPPITGSMNVVNLLTSGLKDVVGATFAVEPDPEKAALFLRRTIEDKRKALGLDARSVEYASQKCLLAQYLLWILISSPRHTPVCLRVETRTRLDLEPRSFF